MKNHCKTQFSNVLQCPHQCRASMIIKVVERYFQRSQPVKNNRFNEFISLCIRRFNGSLKLALLSSPELSKAVNETRDR